MFLTGFCDAVFLLAVVGFLVLESHTNRWAVAFSIVVLLIGLVPSVHDITLSMRLRGTPGPAGELARERQYKPLGVAAAYLVGLAIAARWPTGVTSSVLNLAYVAGFLLAVRWFVRKAPAPEARE